jgi:hypothetical protein
MSAFYRILLLVALSAATLFAVPVTWTLSGVTFADGGTASGTFVYDADTGLYSSFNITTTTGSARTGATYHFGTNIYAPEYSLMVTVGSGDLTGTPALYLVFSSLLSNGGGTVPLVLGADPDTTSSEASCSDAACGTSEPVARQVTAGSITTNPVTPTPAPPTWILGLIGLAALGLMMLMRKPGRVSA